jgi:hypothetical protein
MCPKILFYRRAEQRHPPFWRPPPCSITSSGNRRTDETQLASIPRGETVWLCGMVNKRQPASSPWWLVRDVRVVWCVFIALHLHSHCPGWLSLEFMLSSTIILLLTLLGLLVFHFVFLSNKLCTIEVLIQVNGERFILCSSSHRTQDLDADGFMKQSLRNIAFIEQKWKKLLLKNIHKFFSALLVLK